MARIDLPGEVWRDIAGWEGSYQVSDLGRVYSVRRRGAARSGRFLRTTTCARGHLSLELARNGAGRHFYVHVLVALAFHGPCPQGLQVRHLNGDPADNRASNLRYGTASENSYDSVRHGTHPMARKTHCKRQHPFTAENTRVYQGRRHCRACEAERCRRKRAQVRALGAVTWPDVAERGAA